jgi:hypothetical protein
MPPRPRRDRPTDSRPSREGGGGPVVGDAAAEVARFAQLVREQAKREQARVADERRRAAEERRKADEAAAEGRRLDEARAAKERAARALKSARARGTNAAVAEAEQAYKRALADLLAVEHGERPAWAPVAAEAPEAAAEEPEADEDGAPG